MADKKAYEHLIGKKIRIADMVGEQKYNGKIGVVELVDDAGQLHGTWGWLAIQPEHDSFEVLEDG